MFYQPKYLQNNQKKRLNQKSQTYNNNFIDDPNSDKELLQNYQCITLLDQQNNQIAKKIEQLKIMIDQQNQKSSIYLNKIIENKKSIAQLQRQYLYENQQKNISLKQILINIKKQHDKDQQNKNQQTKLKGKKYQDTINKWIEQLSISDQFDRLYTNQDQTPKKKVKLRVIKNQNQQNKNRPKYLSLKSKGYSVQLNRDIQHNKSIQSISYTIQNSQKINPQHLYHIGAIKKNRITRINVQLYKKYQNN